MKLIGPLVLLALVSLVEGDVVDSFADSCPQFFLNKVPPTVLTDQNDQNRYQQICQRYNNVHSFATLYDTKNRIPVYSAYVYQEPKTSRPKAVWRTEPKLTSQAVDDDYKNSGYTRGHVNPSCYNCEPKATFTLTNVAPQTQYDNGNWEKQVETPLKEKIKSDCNLENNNLAYTVTGVIPGQKFIKKRSGNIEQKRVNIPSYYWTAFSCLKKDQKSCMSGGYLLEMTERDKGVKAAYFNNIGDLNRKLSELYFTPFTVFSETTPAAQGFLARCIGWFKSWFPAWLTGRG